MKGLGRWGFETQDYNVHYESLDVYPVHCIEKNDLWVLSYIFEGLARITLIKTSLTAQFLKRSRIQKSMKSWTYLMLHVMKMLMTPC